MEHLSCVVLLLLFCLGIVSGVLLLNHSLLHGLLGASLIDNFLLQGLLSLGISQLRL